MALDLPEDAPLEVLVNAIKLRWRIERDYEELKSELGLAHFEGRGLARIPSPRDALHRRLWIPDPRKGGFPPLSNPGAPKT